MFFLKGAWSYDYKSIDDYICYFSRGIYDDLFRRYYIWLHFTCNRYKKDKKKLVNVALKMKEIGIKICGKAFILTFIFLCLMEK